MDENYIMYLPEEFNDANLRAAVVLVLTIPVKPGHCMAVYQLAMFVCAVFPSVAWRDRRRC